MSDEQSKLMLHVFVILLLQSIPSYTPGLYFSPHYSWSTWSTDYVVLCTDYMMSLPLLCSSLIVLIAILDLKLLKTSALIKNWTSWSSHKPRFCHLNLYLISSSNKRHLLIRFEVTFCNDNYKWLIRVAI